MTALDLLRELANRAAQGEIAAVAIVVHWRTGESSHTTSDIEDLPAMIGDLAVLQHDLVVEASSHQDNDDEDAEPETAPFVSGIQ